MNESKTSSTQQRREHAAWPAFPATALLAAMATLSVLWAAEAAAADVTPVGYWRAIDSDTRRPTSIVHIVDGPNGLTGKIQTLLDPKGSPGAICNQCEGDRRNKPLVGLDVIRQARPDASDPNLWTGGEILDPENGKAYNLQLKLVDGGQKLDVRGYLGAPLLGRTQTWVRVDESNREVAVAPVPVQVPEAVAGPAATTQAASRSSGMTVPSAPTSPMPTSIGAQAAAAARPTASTTPARAAVMTTTTSGTDATPLGLWTAVDGDTNRETSLVRIVDGPNGITGRIVKMLDRDVRTSQSCTQCEGDRRGKPLVGLDIIRQAKPDASEPGVWSGGEVLDPENGKTYSLQLKPVDGGRKLEVRGYLVSPMLGRTQTWVRVE